jgi:HEAT repeat protein
LRFAELDRKRSFVASGAFVLALLLWFGGCGKTPDYYIGQLKNMQASERTKAANELIRFDADDVVPLLVQEAQSGYIRVRFEVIGLLGRFKDSRGIPALIAALDDKSPNVAARAALALAQMRVVEALPALLKYARDPSEVTRQYVLGALGPCHSYELEPVLSDSAHRVILHALQASKPKWRISALQSLREFGYKDGMEGVIRLSRDPSPEVRHVAVQALGQIGSGKHVVPPGIDSIQTVSARARDNIIEALLVAFDASELQSIRTKAVRALTEIGGARVVEPIEKLARGGSDEDQLEAQRALDKLRPGAG